LLTHAPVARLAVLRARPWSRTLRASGPLRELVRLPLSRKPRVGGQSPRTFKPGQGATMNQQGQRTHCQPPRQFDHHRLDAWHVAKQALIEGLRILNDLPRGFASL
jgi:hypothetical protein